MKKLYRIRPITIESAQQAAKILREMAEKLKNHKKLMEQPLNKHYEEPALSLEEAAEEDEYVSNHNTENVSFIEMAIINSYLHDAYRNKQQEVKVESYGEVDNIGRISFGGMFNNTSGYWFDSYFEGDENHFKLQTCMYIDSRGDLVNQISITAKAGLNTKQFEEVFKKLKSLAFNNSEFKGKCVKVKVKEGSFRGIEIINIEDSQNELILNEVQIKFIKHFISRVGRGGNARYLLNGEPGTGKTESIREIARALMPHVTFVIPEFRTTEDLTSIMEACEIFDNAVIIMDDVDLYLGSREYGSYTSLLGQFLSFFDGVKKRKISLLASTNDKGLVDKAAERPGRFNFTLDYSFLDDDQIVKVCNIHLDEEWQIEEVYDALKGKVNGKKAKITGAFIANLADNIREMAEDDPEWDIKDTVSLIRESYKGFYSSQVEKNKESIGFIN